MSRLDGLIDTSRNKPVDGDALEIAVEAAEAQAPSRASSMRLAHTLRRDTPAAGLRPTTPISVPIVDPHTRPTMPPPIAPAERSDTLRAMIPAAPAKLAQGSVPDFPAYRADGVPEAHDHQRVTARIAPADVEAMQHTSVDIPIEADEDTSRPIDALDAAAPVTYPSVRPASGRLLGIVLMLILLAGAGVTAAALFLY